MVLICLLFCLMASDDWGTGLGSFLSHAEGVRESLNVIEMALGF